MKLVIFGATGGIGSQVVAQGLSAGHQVTAVARRPDTIAIRHENLEVIRGDVLDPATFKEAMIGKDAVISALGVNGLGPTTLYSQGVANLIAGMQMANVRRLVCISASGLDPGPLWQRVIARPLLWAFLGNSYRDLVRMETEVRQSRLDWTILRPVRLTDGPRTASYQSGVNRHLSTGSLISRADVADFILTHLEDRSVDCSVVEIAY